MAQSDPRSSACDLIPAEVLAHVPGFGEAGSAARCRRLFGGTVNASFRVDTAAGSFVVRMHGRRGSELGADRAREAALHRAAAAVGVAPAVRYADEAHRFMIMDFVRGPVWLARDFSRADRLRGLCESLSALHGAPVPAVAPFDPEAVLAGHARRVLEAEPREAELVGRLLKQGEAALRGCRSGEREPVLVHNDLHHSNLIGEKAPMLIDWEYAAVADPLYDLGCVLAYYPQAQRHAALLLAGTGLEGSATPGMLDHACRLYVLIFWFWYRVRRIGSPPRDDELAIEQELLRRLP